jgi:long-chain acyl-CoA synthetase
MDVTPYLEVMHPAPRVLFESLEARRTRPRFMLPTGDGDWQAVTWGAFAREVEEVTLALEHMGLEREDRATIFGYNSVSWMSAALAIQAAGGAMVPIYPSSTAQQAIYVITHSDARVLYIDSQAHLTALLEHRSDFALGLLAIVALGDDVDMASAIDSLPEEAHSLDRDQRALLIERFHTWSQARAIGQSIAEQSPGRIMELLDAISLDQAAVMLYTSGTTGAPKGVPLTHRNIGVNGQDWLRCNAPLLEQGYTDLLWLPLSHIFGFGEVCLGNTLGFVTYWSSPLRVLTDLPVVKPEVFMSVPRLFEKLATHAMEGEDVTAQRDLLNGVTGGNLRFCLSGGAGLKPAIKQFLHAHDMLIIEGYGLTEASPTLTLNRPGDFRFDSVGKPLPSVEIKLAEDGEILARGPSIFHGYHKNEKATADTFTSDGWLLTGDVGRWTEDGFLEIIVTAGGKNIPPANIELNFRDEALIAHLVVYGEGKPYLTAGVWLDDAVVVQRLGDQGSDAQRFELAQECIDRVNASLPRHETIKRFALIKEPLTVEGGLVTPTLKIKRKKVYAHFAQAFEDLYQ